MIDAGKRGLRVRRSRRGGSRPILVAAGWALILGLGACAASEVPRVAAPAPSEPLGWRLERDFRLVEVLGQGIRLPLPDAEGWRRDPGETKTWVGNHTATDSRLIVRTFRADGVARAQDCERQMRLWRRDLPLLAPEQRTETRRVRLDGGFAGELVTGVAPHTEHGGISGHALLLASDGRQCLCLAFSTSASGADAASIVGARLGSITSGSFERAQRIGVEASLSPPRAAR